MKTKQEWFDEYAVSHQNSTNKAIHYICVPVIFFSIVGMLMSIKTDFLNEIIGVNNPFIENWATVVLLILLFLFYLRLSFKSFLIMTLFSAVSIYLNAIIGANTSLFYVSLAIFVIAWIGQFYGHHIEGKKPSFLKDLQFLLIGPIWVFQKMLGFS